MTAEREAAYLAALAREKSGYEARLKALKEGKQDPLGEEQLKARVAAVAAEQKRFAGKKAKDADSE